MRNAARALGLISLAGLTVFMYVTIGAGMAVALVLEELRR